MICVAVLLGVVAALVASMLARIGGASYIDAIGRGSITFVATITTVVLLMTSGGLLSGK